MERFAKGKVRTATLFFNSYVRERRRKKGGKEEEGTPEELRHCREKEYRDELKYLERE